VQLWNSRENGFSATDVLSMDSIYKERWVDNLR